jgi:hypothetical protein
LRGGAKQLFAGIVREKQPVEYSQSGFWDDNILCAGCESLFGEWDAYGFEVLGNPPGNNGPLSTDADLQAFILRNVDYTKLKLFILGTLWRASVTKHKFFEEIDLGPDEPHIGNLIRNGQPGPMEEYPVIIGRLIRQRYEQVIFTPWTSKLEGINVCVLYLPAVKIIIRVDKRPLPPELVVVALKPFGENIALPLPLEGTEFQKLQAMKDISMRWQPRRPPK